MNWPVKLIAFYLPQFHPSPESDRWLGQGFSEWTSVSRAKPLFPGHHQPQLPTDLGFYDLLAPEVREKQAALALEYGIHGFCYYYYRFPGGKRLFDQPLDDMLRSGKPDFPFCLCWANEDWTRTESHGRQEVLLEQEYSDENDVAFIRSLLPYFKDPRYIRVNDHPLLLIRQAHAFPDIRRSIGLWRSEMRKSGVGEIFLICMEECGELIAPQLGFDATCEHPANTSGIPEEPRSASIHESFRGKIFDYGKAIANRLRQHPKSFRYFRGAMPSWDSTANQGNLANIFVNSSPEKYNYWLSELIDQTKRSYPPGERFVFINAWNEWPNGAHLEPDQQNGRAYLEATLAALRGERLSDGEFLEPIHYQDWIKTRTLTQQQLDWFRIRIAAWGKPCKFHLALLHGKEHSIDWLAASIQSLTAQYYSNIQVSIVSIAAAPAGFAASEKLDWRQYSSEGAFAAINDLLLSSNADWVGVIRSGDRVAAHSLLTVGEFAFSHPEARAIYTDTDELDGKGDRCTPRFKPDFNLDLARSYPSYINDFIFFERTAFAAASGFDAALGGLHSADLALRIFESYGETGVGHVADVLFHRGNDGSSAQMPNMPARQIVSRHLQRIGIAATVGDGAIADSVRVKYQHGNRPLVSIIIPTKDQIEMLQRCIESIFEKTAYPNFELLIVDNASETQAAKEYLSGLNQLRDERIRVLEYAESFNLSAMNNLAANAARGKLLLLLRSDTAALHDDWLDAMVAHALRPDVGAVGARLLLNSGKLQHAGVVIGMRGVADHPFYKRHFSELGPWGRLQLEQNLSAVAGACLLIRKEVYHEAGGLDETTFKVWLNDVDLCLRLREAGYRIVWTPFATLLHEGSRSLPKYSIDVANNPARMLREDPELHAFISRWLRYMARDPAYNTNLSLKRHHAAVETDPVISWNPTPWNPVPRVLGLYADREGCGEYRIFAPIRALAGANRIVGAVSCAHYPPAEIERIAPTAIIVQRQVKPTDIALIRSYRDYSSSHIVFELDDLITDIPKENAAARAFSASIMDDLRRAVGLCNRLVVSTQPLADAYGKFASEVVVVHNYLAKSAWAPLVPKRRKHPKPRIGWAGSVTHGGDLALIEEVMKQTSDKVDWIFMGMCPPNLRNHVAEYHAPIAIDAYPAKLASLDLDIAIAPLAVNAFNEAKSHLKVLEYGALGYPVICTDITPYQGAFPVTRVRNRPQDWVKAIRALAFDPARAAAEGDRLRDHVRQHWMLEDHLDEWLAAWLP